MSAAAHQERLMTIIRGRMSRKRAIVVSELNQVVFESSY